MQDLITQLKEAGELSNADVEAAVGQLLSMAIDEEFKAEFLKTLRAKGETAAEIAAFATALLGRAVDPGIDPARLTGPMIDVCGTGGDKMELFNVSTTSMFVLAAGGAVVVKHGNRAITSQCGGADVLEELGIQIDSPPARLKRCVETVGLGFIFAPSYHPAFKAIGPVRKRLAAQGVPTIFNVLGPLLNPARPPYQLVGVFSSVLLDRLGATLAFLGRTQAWVFAGQTKEGAFIDEISTAGPTDLREVGRKGTLERRIAGPEEVGLALATIDDLRGGDRRENARILVSILDGSERGPKRDIVALNAAAGFVVAGLATDLRAGIALAVRQIDEGRAWAKLRALQAFS